MTGTLARAVLAVVALVAVLVAAPLLLLALAGNPWPEQLGTGELPTGARIVAWLTSPDDGGLLLGALAITGWVAWAVLTGSMLLELGARLFGRQAPRLPGLAAPQRLAQLLVGAALATLATPGISYANAAYLDSTVVVAQQQPEPSQDPVGTVGSTELTHEVASGDWMWHIAGRYLGDEHRYPEIAALNPDLAERYTRFPDHIEPGDRLTLPADATDRGPRAYATGARSGDSAPDPPPVPVPAPDPPPAPAPDPPPAPAPDPAPGPEPQPAPTAEAPPVPRDVSAPGPAGSPPAPEADLPQQAAAPEVSSSAPAPLLAAGVVASVLMVAVVTYRRRKAAHRRYGRRVAPADTQVEAQVHAEATVEVTRLDRALRTLAARLNAADASWPDIGAVWLDDDDIRLVLATPHPQPPPDPFQQHGSDVWVLPAGAALPEDADMVLAPLPALVTLASQPGRHLLVDLERLGMLTVAGDPARRGDLLRHVAAELAHHPWADAVEVILAGFPSAQAQLLASLRPGRVRVADSLADAVAQLQQRAEQIDAALTGHGLPDAWQGRVGDTAGDTWTPQLLLVYDGGSEPAVAKLGERLAASRRGAVAVVSCGGPAVGGCLRLGADGTLTAEFLPAADGLPAAALPAELLPPLADLVRQAAGSTQDYPIPPAAEPWAAGTDAAGARLPHAPPAVDWNADTPTLPLPTLAAQDAAGPRLEILGPVRVGAAGPVPGRRRAACEELLVLLVARPDGVTAAEIVTALWPHRRASASARTEVITSLRRWLGRAPGGGWWLPEADRHGRYRLRDGVWVDWYEFRRLRARAQRSGDIADLRAALRLVRGAPLARTGADDLAVAYPWRTDGGLAPDILVAGVVDAAHDLVKRCLADGNTAAARWAVRQAWLADPARDDDQPWRDLMQVVHAERGPEQVKAVVRELLAWRDVDAVDELSPATRSHVTALLAADPGRGEPNRAVTGGATPAPGR